MAETTINPDVEFVRKDVFEARMDRMEMLMEKTLMEMKADNEKLRSELSTAVSGMRADNEKLRSEVKAEVLDIRGDIRTLNARIDGLQTGVYWGFTVLALLFGFVTFAPSITDFLRNLRKPSVTLEDVERVVDAALQRAKLQS